MTRTEKFKDLRKQISKEIEQEYSKDVQKWTIDNRLYNIDKKLDYLTDTLERQSESLYHIAKYDDYKHTIEDMFENPIEQLNDLIESVKR